MCDHRHSAVTYGAKITTVAWCNVKHHSDVTYVAKNASKIQTTVAWCKITHHNDVTYVAKKNTSKIQTRTGAWCTFTQRGDVTHAAWTRTVWPKRVQGPPQHCCAATLLSHDTNHGTRRRWTRRIDQNRKNGEERVLQETRESRNKRREGNCIAEVGPSASHSPL